MATTFKDLQNAVISIIHSGTVDQEMRCALAGDIDAAQLTFTVDDVSQLSRGLIEVDSELMWVKTTDPASNTVTLSPFGRGYGDTTATTHNVGAMVVNTPRFPRQSVKNAIQDTLNSVYPDLFQVKTYEGDTSVSTQLTYSVPADVGWVIRVEWDTIGPSGMWRPVRRWKLDPSADATAYPTGKTLDIYQGMVPGRTIKVTYAASPGELTNDTDTLVSTGLTEDCRDVLIYGAAARCLQAMEAARLNPGAVEQQHRAELTPPGAATNAARAYFQLYQMRLEDQRDHLQRLYPTVSHLTS